MLSLCAHKAVTFFMSPKACDSDPQLIREGSGWRTRVSTFEAGALFVKAGNIRTEKWTFAVAADRLYAARNEQEDNGARLERR